MPLGKAIQYGSLSARCHVIRSRLITPQVLEQLAASRGIGDFAGALSATPYGAFISEMSARGVQQGLSEAFAYQRHKIIQTLQKRHQEIFKLFFAIKYTLLDKKIATIAAKNPEEIIYQVDRTYIGLLKKSMVEISSWERSQLKKIVGSYFDLLNLYNLVKSRLLHRLTIEETLTYMLPFAEKFNLDELAKLCHAQNLQQLSSAIEPILHEKFDSYETFRKALYRYHRQHLLSVWSGYPFSIVIPFSLLRLIEIEVSDLGAIAEGVAYGLDKKEIILMTAGN